MIFSGLAPKTLGFCIAGRRDELFMRLREEGMGTCRVVYFGLLFGIDLITI